MARKLGPAEAAPQDPSGEAAAAAAALGLSEQAPSYEDAVRTPSNHVPTVDSPFNFPAQAETQSELPPYEAPPLAEASSSSSQQHQSQKPIAIPQTYPNASSGFVTAYPPSLLSHGITEDTWRSFLDTISAFLTAKVSDRAVSHAGDMAKELGSGTMSFGKDLFSHAKSVGKTIVEDAKRGNILGVTVNIIAGAVSIPVHTALGATGAVVSLPGSALSAVTKRPRTPLERAATYAAVANKDWLHARGLHAALYDTTGLAKMMNMPVLSFIEVAGGGAKNGSATAQLAALEGHLERLNVDEGVQLTMTQTSLWLVLAPLQFEKPIAE